MINLFSLSIVSFVLAAVLWVCVACVNPVAIITVATVLVISLMTMVRDASTIYLSFRIPEESTVTGQVRFLFCPFSQPVADEPHRLLVH